MAVEVDLASVAAFSSLPESSLSSLLDRPTTEAVKSLLESISVKAKDYDKVKSQSTRLEVELEQTVRTRESKIKVFKTSAERALTETSKLRGDLQQSENARSKLESDIEQMRSSTTQEASEVTTLRSRISSLEASHRDTVVLLESKTSAYDKLGQDLSSQHQKAVELRKHIATLEQSLQTSNSSVANAKFKEHSLSQELDLARKNNDWYESELKTKQAEYTKFRKEKNERIADLSRTNEQSISETEARRRSEASTKNRLEDQTRKMEELLLQLQQVREEKETESQNFSADLESANRLAELQKDSADAAKQRVQELQQDLDDLREQLAEELGRARAEVDSERADKEAAEQRVAELETTIEQRESELDRVRAQPTTPQRIVNGSGISTPVRPGTPSGIFTPATSRMKGSMTMTQLYSAYHTLERDLANEKRAKEELQMNLDSMLQDMESTAPEIEELRSDNARLQKEVVEVSELLDAAVHERERAIAEARALRGEVEINSKNVLLLTQQVRDSAAQVKVLLMEQHINNSDQELTPEEVAEIRKHAAAQDTSGLNDTGRLISENLTVFRNIAELEERNLYLLNMLRDLGDKMEAQEERKAQETITNLQGELDDLRKHNDNLKAQMQAKETVEKALKQEMEIFRSRIARQNHPVDPNDFSRSLPLPRGASPGQVPDPSVNEGESDYAKLLKDLQTHFESFRREASTDQTSLRKQLNELSAKNHQLSSESIRTSTLLTSANQQYESLQAQYKDMRDSLENMKRSRDSAMDTASRQELRAQQSTEELVEMRGLLESTRREASNLKAEKDLWKTVENRLLEDNTSLRSERSRLDQMNGSLQSLLNEREQSDAEIRRRLTAQLEALEAELQTTKRKLDEELEESKRVTVRRDYEHEQSQKRIDDLISNLGSVREELVAAKTARDHLQSRVDELTVEVRSAEERLAVLTQPPTTQAEASEQNTISREKELIIEISELKRDLELKNAELNQANEQVEIFKEISQSSEERVQELSDANNQYREETEAALAESERRIADLQQRLEDISAELNTTNTELSQVRDQQSEASRRLDEQKAGFEAEMARLREAEERSADQAQFNLEASKAQAQIATEAQQNYENELLKHAEAAKALQTVRSETNELRLKVIDLETQIKTVRTTLAQKEESWTELRGRYEHEIQDLRTRREELMSQNTILHNQLENVTKQISSLQKDRAANTWVETDPGLDSSHGDMQEVIKYLRREKEIIEVQYHLSSQDVKRLRQQLETAQKLLDDTRLKLDQQRQAETDAAQHTQNHNKLMETLNELNLHRESNVTLRAEVKQLSQSSKEKTDRVEELSTEIEPLKTRIAELENLGEMREGEMKLLQEDRDHWQQRTQNILSKYDRVDPAEMEALKGKIAQLEIERDEASAARAAMQTQMDTVPEQIETARQELRGRLGEQFKARSKELSGRISAKQTEVDSAVAEKSQLQAELDSVREDLEQARAQAAASAAPPTTNGVADVPEQEKNNDHEEGEDLSGQITELEEKIRQLEQSLAEKEQQLSFLQSEQDQKFNARELQLKEILNKRLADVKKEAQDAKTLALESLESDLKARYEAEMEEIRSKSVPVSTELRQPSQSSPTQSPTSPVDEDSLPVLSEQQARLLVQRNETVKRIIVTNVKKRVEAREAQLREELGAQGATQDAKDLEQKFAVEKEALIKQKEEEFDNEKTAMIKAHNENLAAEKQVLMDQNEQLRKQHLDFDRQSEKKIADQVAMAEKKMAVKMNMADNRAKMATAKIEVVKKAAEDTPEKPVIEVWNVAKDTKPLASTPKPGFTVSDSSSAPPSSPAQPKAVTTEGQPSTESPSQPPASKVSNGPVTQGQNVGAGSTNTRGGSNGTRGAASMRGGRGSSQSGIPQPQQSGGGQTNATFHRGTGIPRAGGHGGAPGRGRGGGPNVQTGIPQAPGQRSASASSTGRGGVQFNPAAAQFTPGKRAREEGEGSDAGNAEKRIRGASATGAP